MGFFLERCRAFVSGLYVVRSKSYEHFLCELGDIMLKKTNLLIAVVAVCGTHSAFAGGSETMPVTSFTPYFYSELGLGYADTDYNDFYQSFNDESQNLSGTNNENGGLLLSSNVGYVLLPRLAIEFGGGYLPEYKADAYDGSSEDDFKVSSWYLFSAGRVEVPILERVDMYSKVGMAYRHMVVMLDDNEIDDYYWAPILGAGVSYHVKEKINISVEYNYIGSSNDTNEGLRAPAIDLYMAKIGYQFNI